MVEQVAKNRTTTPEIGAFAMREDARVLVAIPCYNEELAIAGIVLRARRFATDVLVIDDGSRDGTVETAILAGAQVIQNPGNKGKGYSVQRAFKHAADHDYDAIVLMDGDGQHDADEIPRLLEPVLGRNGSSVDISLGFRFGELTEMPMWRRVGKRVLDYATAAGGAGIVTDSQCGYRAFGRRAILELSSRLSNDGFGVESEQLVHARDAGLSTENVTITCKYDGIDGSTKGPIEHAAGVLANIFEAMTMKRPLVYIGLPSFALALVSMLAGARALGLYDSSGGFSIPWAVIATATSMLSVLGAFTALNLNMIAIVERKLRARV